MPEVHATARLTLDPADAWTHIGPFEAVGDWHPMLARVQSDGDAPGAVRHVETVQGDRQVERMTERDPAKHAYRYVMQETALPVDDYSAEFRIDAAPLGGSVVTWTARFDVTSGDEQQTVHLIGRFIAAGVDALAERYG